jgi:hypothetical protein
MNRPGRLRQHGEPMLFDDPLRGAQVVAHPAQSHLETG